MLARLDAKSAVWIDAADEKKLIRAIEVCILAKKPLSQLHRDGRNPLQGWRAVKIGLAPEREALYARVHARTDSMLAKGWMEEVKGLVASGLPRDAKPFDFIGYRELRKVLEKETSLEQARVAIQQATRRYAKRQMTWFRKEEGTYWISGLGDDREVQKRALERIHMELAAY
jgi:tRNA dimethylallyltransferase